MPAACAAGMGPLKFPVLGDVRVQGWRDAVSLHGKPVPRVDEAGHGFRERQHGPGVEELFKLIAILPGQTFSQVFARVGRAAKRGVKESDASVAATQLLVPIIHEVEAR